MTSEQYDRWKDFTLRMVNVAVGARKRAPSRADVRANIEFFFECRMEPETWRHVRDWDRTEDWIDDAGRKHHDYCPADHIADLAEHFIPNYWAIVNSQSRYERERERWVDPVSCCVRAGLDVAVAPSAGVCGFTAGDVRAMYPEGAPSWLKAFFAPGDVIALYPTRIEGIFIPKVTGFDNRTFDELPDAEPVWL
jgi:hypothetical protein